VAFLSGTVGTPVSGVVATFSSANPAATARDFFATINWGDGHFTNGVVTANGQGGFDVSGTNTYTSAGLFSIAVTAVDFGGSQVAINNTAQVSKVATQVALSSSTSNGVTGQSITFTATVTSAPGGVTPTGTVTFFDGTRLLGVGALDASGVARLATTFPPGSHSITAVYNGDGASVTSQSTAISQSISPDVTGLLLFEFGPSRSFRGLLVRHLTIRNLGGNAIGGPLFLVLDHLQPRARLVHAIGTSKTFSPLGSPFVAVGAGLGPGASTSVNLVFATRARKLNFSVRVLSGVAQP
jgi:hypothetical protein